MKNKIVVIGGGPAGIEAAKEAASLGRDVVLISEGPIGGRAGWHSLLPSKVWLSAAELSAHAPGTADPQQIVAQVRAVKDGWNAQEKNKLEELGVTILSGVGSFASAQTVIVRDGGGELLAEFAAAPVLVASGSIPFFPPGLQPDGKRVLAPRFLSQLDALPASMLVVGAGATGCESAYLFNALGVKVTWIVDQYGILPQMDPDAGAALGKALAEQGVRLVDGQMVERLERAHDSVTAVLADGAAYAAEMAFVAVGRRADVGRLNLDAAGIETEANGFVPVDEYGRTTNKNVYVIGDADGRAMTANKAQSQARIAARRACGARTDPFKMVEIVLPVYTRPQIAQVGELSEPAIVTTRIPYSESMKTHILGESGGFFKLAYDARGGKVRGALAVGPHAAEVVTPVAAAIRQEADVAALAALFAAYPTLSELPFIAARTAIREGSAAWK